MKDKLTHFSSFFNIPADGSGDPGQAQASIAWTEG
jgi:hypothetical protein